MLLPNNNYVRCPECGEVRFKPTTMSLFKWDEEGSVYPASTEVSYFCSKCGTPAPFEYNQTNNTGTLH